MLLLAIIVILSYLVGSIPNSIIISKAVQWNRYQKPRQRKCWWYKCDESFGWKYGLIVIFLDALKGAIAVVIISRLFYGPLPFENVSPFDDFTLVQIIAGMSAVIGHIWTVFAGFQRWKRNCYCTWNAFNFNYN